MAKVPNWAREGFGLGQSGFGGFQSRVFVVEPGRASRRTALAMPSQGFGSKGGKAGLFLFHFIDTPVGKLGSSYHRMDRSIVRMKQSSVTLHSKAG
jgi:hypothetical protein